jgi:hypothetical protein
MQNGSRSLLSPIVIPKTKRFRIFSLTQNFEKSYRFEPPISVKKKENQKKSGKMYISELQLTCCLFV